MKRPPPIWCLYSKADGTYIRCNVEYLDAIRSLRPGEELVELVAKVERKRRRKR
jgi:hypothetical protein